MKVPAIVTFLILSCPTFLIGQSTWYVPDDFTTIQGAISDVSVQDGDTIIVRPGTYVENVRIVGKSITLAGEAGAKETVIDGGQLDSALLVNELDAAPSLIRGFTLTNGIGVLEGPGIFRGGGMYVTLSSPTIEDCVFTDNTAMEGAGLWITLGSNAMVLRCAFIENSSDSLGGGCGVGDFSNPVFSHCTFLDNFSSSYGGGLNIRNECAPVLNSCIFVGNSVGINRGGGIHTSLKSTVKAGNCTFYGNSATNGGGVSDIFSTNPSVYANCIFWNNVPDQIFTDLATPIVAYSCVQGGYTGTGNIDVDPLFVDPLNRDFHFTYSSPCRNSGVNSLVFTSEDFDGNPRIIDGTVDMGADEFYTHLYITGDQAPGGSIEGKMVGLPGTSPVYLFIGLGGIKPSPSFTNYGDLWLLPPLLSLPLVPIPANGVLALPATLPASQPAPYDVPMQALVGLDSDSLTNLYVLEVRY